MTINITVTSVHMEHEGGTKEYLLDHIHATDTSQGGNNVVVNHTVSRWGGIGKRRSAKVGHDPIAAHMDKTRESKVKRGYSAPAGRTVIDYPSFDRLKVAHPELHRVLVDHEILPTSATTSVRPPESEPVFNLPPGRPNATDLNPNLGIF